MAEVNFIVETLTSVGLILFVTLQSIVKALIPVKYQQKKDISKDTVLITGSGCGIGRALAIRLAKMGCRLVLWDINEEGNNETAAEIKKFGGQAHPYTVDLSKREDVYKMADQVLTELGSVDILVNNAGIVYNETVMESSDEHLEKTININLFSHFWTTKAFLPAMMEKDYGHIVGMASIAGLIALPKAAAYPTTKHGVVGFMESLNLEMKVMQKSIETTVVCPYFTNTPFLHQLNHAVTPRFPSLLPLLEPDYVVSKTIEAIQTNQEILYIPRIIYFLMVLKSIWMGGYHFTHYQARLQNHCVLPCKDDEMLEGGQFGLVCDFATLAVCQGYSGGTSIGYC